MAQGASGSSHSQAAGAAERYRFGGVSRARSASPDRLPGSYRRIAGSFDHGRRRVAARLLRLFGCEDWNIGVIGQTAADIVRRGICEPVRWLERPSRWQMLADPSCCLRPDGGLTLYAEAMDHRVGRGEIWAAEIPPGAAPGEASFQPLLAAPVHLSYPFPFIDDAGRACLTAEAWRAGEAPLWRRDDTGWRLGPPLLSGLPLVDPTLWRGPDRWWLFCTLEDDAPQAHLYIFYADRVAGPWQPHKANPVKRDPGSSRPAGPLFMVDDMLIRPAQDCSRTYGGAVVLNAVTRLDPQGFEEEPCRRLEPVRGPFSRGLHTFCPAGAVTLIDGKRWRVRSRLDPLELLRGSTGGRQRLAGAATPPANPSAKMIAP